MPTPRRREPAQPEDAARLYSRAVRLLAVHDRTEADLRTRLSRHGDAADVEAALGRLREQGYLDDARFADAFTRHEALERGAGARLVRHELRAHGVGEPLVAQAAAVAAAAELDTAREVARRALPSLAGLAPEARVRRLAGRLARRGYASAIVYQVVREILGGARLGEGGEAAIEALGAQGEASDPGEAD